MENHYLRPLGHAASGSMRLTGLAVIAALGQGPHGLCGRVWAQPQAAPGIEERLKEEDAGRQALQAFVDLREENAELEVRDTQQAIAVYQKFFENTGYRYPQVGIAVSSTIARMYWLDLNDQTKALEIYDWALQRYGADPRAQRLVDDRKQLAVGMKQLTPAALPQVNSAGGDTTSQVILKGAAAPSTASEQAESVLTQVNVDGTLGTKPGRQADSVLAKATAPTYPWHKPQGSSFPSPVTVPKEALPAQVSITPARIGVGVATQERAALKNGLPVVGLPRSAPGLASRAAKVTALQSMPKASKAQGSVSSVGSTEKVALLPNQQAKKSSPNSEERQGRVGNVRPDIMHAAFVLAQIDAGRVTAEEALSRGLLSMPDLLDGLAGGGSPATLTQISKLLLKRVDDAKVMEQILKSPTAVRLRIAHAWAFEEVNPHCVPLYQSVMYEPTAGNEANIAGTEPGDGAGAQKKRSSSYDRVCQALGEYYEFSGRPDLALAMFEQVLKYQKDRTGLAANATVGAARSYLRLGQPDKAKEMYEQVAAKGYAWATGVMLIDQARTLIAAGRQEEARKLLRVKVEGQFADQIEPVKLVLLGLSYFQSKKLPEARQYTLQAIDEYRTLANPFQGEGTEVIMASAEARLKVIEQWMEKPVRFETSAVQVLLDPVAVRSLVRRIKVKTFSDGPLTVSSSNNFLKAHLSRAGGSGWCDTPKQSQDEEEWDLTIEIAPEVLRASAKAMLIVTTDQGLQLPLPVDIAPKNPHASPQGAGYRTGG